MSLADFPDNEGARAGAAMICTISEERNRWGVPSGAASSLRWSGYLAVAGTSYPLKRGVTGLFRYVTGGWTLSMQAFSPTFIGQGQTMLLAEANLKSQIHAEYQFLYSKRAFQMTDEERARWAVLQSAIDVAAYIRETPVHGREIGKVHWTRGRWYGRYSGGVSVTWMDGRTETVPFDSAPAEFAGYRDDQWFEANVKREPGTGRLIEIVSVSRMRPIRRMSPEQAAQYWDKLPATSALPVAPQPGV